MVEESGDVGGNEVFIFADADYSGWSVAGGDDFVGIISSNDDKSEDAGQFFDSLADGFFLGRLRARFEVMLLDEVGDDFGVGLGGESVAFGD